jgi:hypothetical protein
VADILVDRNNFFNRKKKRGDQKRRSA